RKGGLSEPGNGASPAAAAAVKITPEPPTERFAGRAGGVSRLGRPAAVTGRTRGTPARAPRGAAGSGVQKGWYRGQTNPSHYGTGVLFRRWRDGDERETRLTGNPAASSY